MNCPSRSDDVLLHPDWNQNPPRFAADLTTCEDLNGTVNSRELRNPPSFGSAPLGLPRCDVGNCDAEPTGKPWPAAGEGVKGPCDGPCTRKPATKAEYRAGLDIRADQVTFHFWSGWVRWLSSVLATSVVLVISGGTIWPQTSTEHSKPLKRALSIPTIDHLAKRDGCASGSAQTDYDLAFHVGGLFIILFVSFTACAFPVLVIKFPRLRIPASFLFGAKHFGTGVLIATAFVHLLPTAFLSLSDPCLSGFWTQDYPAMPGAIMLASIFFVAVIEMVFSPCQHVCGGNSGVAAVSRKNELQSIGRKEASENGGNARAQIRRTYSDDVRDMGHLRGRTTSISRTLSQYRKERERMDAIESLGLQKTPGGEGGDECAVEDAEAGHGDHQLTAEQARKKAVMQCFLLEMGILFHSVFIGMSLAVAVGNDFIVLLIAIIFHQTFEGLALGVRIADIEWSTGALQPWLMAVAYGCTTPLGQAIGIATHALYSPNSEVGLLVVGVMNAVSAGFLVFASLVELLSEDFLSDESWQVLRGKRRVLASVLVFFGAFSMSLVGAWA